MTATLPGWGEKELLQEVLVAPRETIVPMPDTRFIEREGWWQMITPSIKQGGLNEVGLSVMRDDEADAVIAATVAEYRALGISRFRWNVAPGSAPANLVERLTRAGLVRGDVRFMARATSGFENPVSPDITVERIHESRIGEYVRVLAEGWNMTDLGPMEASHRMMLAAPGGVHRVFLATYKGRPAGVAASAAGKRSVYLMSGVVLPEFRNLGVYRALVAVRMHDAAARGITLATSQARATTSAPILERLGFQSVVDVPVFSTP